MNSSPSRRAVRSTHSSAPKGRPMVLHGAYDTLLKKEMNSWALLVAGVSFLWLVFQIETARRKDPAGESSDVDPGLSRYAALA